MIKRYLHNIRCRNYRERMLDKITGFMALVAFVTILLLSACVYCPNPGVSCPTFPNAAPRQ